MAPPTPGQPAAQGGPANPPAKVREPGDVFVRHGGVRQPVHLQQQRRVERPKTPHHARASCLTGAGSSETMSTAARVRAASGAPASINDMIFGDISKSRQR